MIKPHCVWNTVSWAFCEQTAFQLLLNNWWPFAVQTKPLCIWQINAFVYVPVKCTEQVVKIEHWRVRGWNCLFWKHCLLEFVFLVLMGASSSPHSKRSVFLSSYWSPPTLINMGKRPLKLRCVRRVVGVWHWEGVKWGMNHFRRAGIASIFTLRMSGTKGKLFYKKALHSDRVWIKL